MAIANRERAENDGLHTSRATLDLLSTVSGNMRIVLWGKTVGRIVDTPRVGGDEVDVKKRRSFP